MGRHCLTRGVSSGCTLIEVVGSGGHRVGVGHSMWMVLGALGWYRLVVGMRNGTGVAGGYGVAGRLPPGHSSSRRGWCRTAQG